MFLLYVLEGCPYCKRAIELLKSHKAEYKTILVPHDDEMKTEYKKNTGMKTFPMVFVSTGCLEKNHFIKIGGSTDLEKYFQKIDEMKNENISTAILSKMSENLKK